MESTAILADCIALNSTESVSWIQFEFVVGSNQLNHFQKYSVFINTQQDVKYLILFFYNATIKADFIS